MTDPLKVTLRLLARPKWRGIPSEQLVYIIQDVQDTIPLSRLPEYQQLLGYQSGHEEYTYYLEQVLEGLQAEIERRRRITYANPQYADKEILAAIKEAVPIEDVLAWYTEVFLHKRQWTYRCTLHGPDNHPSGVIYREEQRGWCHVCNKGGDVFDMVQLFERVPLPKAVERLARHIGLETKPLIRRRRSSKTVDL